MLDKVKLVELLKAKIEDRIAELDKAIKNSQDSANQESKSSMGDKYETSRSMAQNDIGMYEVQKTTALKDKTTLDLLQLQTNFESARVGAVVKTSMGTFFIGISVGKYDYDGQPLMIISTESPIGIALKNAKAGETIQFNQRAIKVEAVY